MAPASSTASTRVSFVPDTPALQTNAADAKVLPRALSPIRSWHFIPATVRIAGLSLLLRLLRFHSAAFSLAFQGVRGAGR
ncbi:hypothetical protein AURDEDRAFT_115990 [Auricularia subglabra TFB-10046 SS5]|nr:hypothetical protein AURDEDRAFT_115990 [Auricularia subglabra TFB-10046 SS5]